VSDDTDVFVLAGHYILPINRLDVTVTWIRSEENETLVAVMVAEGIKVIPDEASRVLSCNCKAIEPGKRGNCSCKSHNIS